ncbi:hypothetical protein [Streptomyces sp. T028]|uniref:hypothetical protein n=1 Tax=Streptomyces sp. T028 TaxID=3394379 RepID=UPI003A8A5365
MGVYSTETSSEQEPPLAVRHEAATITRRTGIEPTVTYENADTIRITHENGPSRIESLHRRGSRALRQCPGWSPS